MPPEIPDDLARRAIEVTIASTPDPGWIRADALAVLDSLHGTLLAVHGGDVVVRQSWGFTATTDAWHCERAAGESASDYAVRSRAWASDFVRDYDGGDEGDPVFVLYFDDQQEAA